MVSAAQAFAAGTHCHKNWQVAALISGHCIRITADTAAPMKTSDVLFIPPDMPHSFASQAGDTPCEAQIASLCFTPSLLPAIAAAMPETEAIANAFADTSKALLAPAAVARRICQILRRMKLESEAGQAMSLLDILTLMASVKNPHVAAVTRYKAIETERMAKAVAYVKANFKHDISLSDVAEATGMRPTTFCNFFKKAAGDTFINYLNSLRIEEACRLLSKRREAISDVAAKAGFNSVEHFIRTFKRVKGVTPARWAAHQLRQG